MNKPSGHFPQQLKDSWGFLGRGGWHPMFAVELFFVLASVFVLTPFTSLVVQSAVSVSGQEALSDTEIASFLLSPLGALAGVLLASVMLTVVMLNYAALLIPAHAIQRGERTTLMITMARLLRCGPDLLALSLRVVIRYLAVILPFALLIVLDYWLLLSGYDINYYLAEKPPKFVAAVAIAAIVLVLLCVILIKITISWFYALPMVLFDRQSARSAKINSEKVTFGHRKLIAFWLVIYVFGTPIISFIIAAPITYAANWLVPQLSGNLPLLALVLGCSVVLCAVLAFVVNFTSTCLLVHQNMKMFRQYVPDRNKSENTDSLGLDDRVGHRIFRIPLGEKFILCMGLVAVLIISLLSYLWIDRLDFDNDSLVIAHRGSSLAAPENTMAAIQKAVDDGADWVEIDVQETADGKVVVFHDSDFKRVGGKSLAIWDAHSNELSGIDIGSWFDPEFSKETTPSLRETLEVCRNKSGVLIELKYYGRDQNLEQRVIDIVEQAGMVDQVMVMSLSYPAVEKVRKLRPTWTVGLLSTVALGDITKLDVDFLGLNSRAATKRLIERAHKNQIDVYVWTVNDPIEISTMISRGADGLITDVPDVALTVIKQRGTLSLSERLMLDLAHIFGYRVKSLEQ
jgi:glycerophosphoryl diester phosphodiesterase